MQEPDLQTDEVPQLVPSASGVVPSTQTELPVAHEVVPARHEPGFWQAAPETQATQDPPLHTWSVPHVVPFGCAVAEFTHTWVPVEHEVVPRRHGSGFPVHDAPAVHATQAPALQTWFVPQVVPFASTVVVSVQVWTPVEQEVVPA